MSHLQDPLPKVERIEGRGAEISASETIPQYALRVVGNATLCRHSYGAIAWLSSEIQASVDTMEAEEVKAALGKRLAWVGAASSAVAVLDILALILILKFWVSPEVYGIATIVVTLFGALELAAELGLSAAIIQRPDHSQEQLSTIFWLNILLGFLFYAAVYATAPLLADLHKHAIIEDLFKVFGINLLLRASYAVHQAQLKKQLRFQEISIVRIFANIADFAAKVGFAAAGYGVWAFVVGHMARSFVFCVGLAWTYRWRPSFVFRLKETKDDLLFGVRTAAGEFLFQIYSNIDYQIVNVYFGSAAVGFYRAAYELVLEPVRFVSGVVVTVAFPAFAKVKNNLAAVMDIYVMFTKQNLVVVLSLITFIFLSADDLLALIFQAEYRSGATAARLLAAVGLLRAVSHIGPPLLDGLGRPDLSVRYHAIAAVMLCAGFFGFAHFYGAEWGYLSVAVGWAVGYPIAFVYLSVAVFRLAEIDTYEYLKRVISIPLAVAMAGIVGLGARLLLQDSPAIYRLLGVALVFFSVAAISLVKVAGIGAERFRK